MKKIFRIVLTVALILILVVAVGVAMFGGAIVRSAVNGAGPKMLGVPVTLKGATFSLLRGHVRLTGLHIGNPKGFKTDSLFDVGTIEIKLKPSSLLSNTIVIEKVLVDAPEITFERGLKRSNFGALIAGLSDKGGSSPKPTGEPAPESKPPPASEPGKKVVIDELTVSGGKVKLSLTGAMGLSVPVALATLSMKDIGRESGTERDGRDRCRRSYPRHGVQVGPCGGGRRRRSGHGRRDDRRRRGRGRRAGHRQRGGRRGPEPRRRRGQGAGRLPRRRREDQCAGPALRQPRQPTSSTLTSGGQLNRRPCRFPTPRVV